MPIAIHEKHLENLLRYLEEDWIAEEALWECDIPNAKAETDALFQSEGYRTLVHDVMHGAISESSEAYIREGLKILKNTPENEHIFFALRFPLEILDTVLTKERDAGVPAHAEDAVFIPGLQRDAILRRLHLDGMWYAADEEGLDSKTAKPVIHAILDEGRQFFNKLSGDHWLDAEDLSLLEQQIANTRALAGTKVMDFERTQEKNTNEIVYQEVPAEVAEAFAKHLESVRAIVARTFQRAAPAAGQAR